LNEVQGNRVIRLPPPERRKWQPVWLFPLIAGLCLLPVYQSAARFLPDKDGQAGPSQKIVDALGRSRPAPAPVAAPAVAPAASLIAPVTQAPSALLDSMMKMTGKPMFLGPVGDHQRAVDCLALAAWYEAGTDVESQRSVVQVILNRVAHPSFPKSVCGVVFQGSQRTTGCQFTFTCDGSMLRRQPSPTAMARARAVAELALQGGVFAAVMQATHYHADYVQPWWSSHLIQRGRVGRHVFYSWPGKRGSLPGRPSSTGEAGLADLMRQSAGAGTDPPGPNEATAPQSQLVTIIPDLGAIVPSIAPPKPRDAVFLTIDMATPSGRWAVSALGQCAGKTGCRVIGYETQDQIARNGAAPAAAREKPVFLFVRDAASGIELALWDCDKVQRPASSQCLPAAGRELTRLLRDNQN
jgi:Cell Wall Hydrolase